jgi:hypothetical protein
MAAARAARVATPSPGAMGEVLDMQTRLHIVEAITVKRELSTWFGNNST